MKINKKVLRVLSIGLLIGIAAVGILAVMAKVGLKDYKIEKIEKTEELKTQKTDDIEETALATSSVVRADREIPAVIDAYIEYSSKDEAVLRSGINGITTYNPDGLYESFQARDNEIQVIYQDSSKNEKYRIIKSTNENPGADYDIYEDHKDIEIGDITADAGLTDEGIRIVKWARGGYNYALVYWTGINEASVTDYIKNIG